VSQSSSVAISVLFDADHAPRRPFEAERKRALLEAVQRVAAPEVPFDLQYSRYGKPELAGGGAYLSLSHSGPWLAAAAGRDRVGIDVEVERPVRHDRLARRLDWPRSLAVDQPEAFFRAWTVWEAAIKAYRRESRSLFARFAPRLEGGTMEVSLGNWHLRYWQPAERVHASALVRARTRPFWRWAQITPAGGGA